VRVRQLSNYSAANIKKMRRCLPILNRQRQSATKVLEMITAEYLEDAAFMNCIYVELNLNILRQLSKGLEPGKVIAAIKRAQKAAESKYGIVSRTILSISRDWDEETALTVVEMASKYRKDNVVGIDVSGDEREKPNKFYKHVFRQAHKSGVKATAHAGENAGVQSVVSAVSETGVSRIGHGIDAASNARIIKLLKNSDIAVEICATSNFMLGHVRSLEAHPCKNLLRAGVSCTFNTDDPLLFGNNIYDEYRNVAQSWQLTTEQIVQASRNGIRYSFLDSGCKRELMQEFDKKAGKCQREFNLITSLQPAFKTAAL